MRMMALLVQLINVAAAHESEHSLSHAIQSDVASEAYGSDSGWSSFVSVVTVCTIVATIIWMHSSASPMPSGLGVVANGAAEVTGWVVSWFRPDGLPALEPLPEPSQYPAHPLDDDGTDDDSSDDPLVNHTPRTRAAILNVTPPVTPYASSEASAQPDSEPDDPGTDEDRVVPADALLGANTGDQTLTVPFRRPFEIIDVRPECGVWVAPTSGTRFHICPACHGLRNATRVMGAFDVSTRLSFPWGREARWGKRAGFLVLMMPLF